MESRKLLGHCHFYRYPNVIIVVVIIIILVIVIAIVIMIITIIVIRNQKEQIESINTTSGSKFTIEMYKMDLDRVQYMVKKYYRTRVLKIEKQLEAIMSGLFLQLFYNSQFLSSW